MNPLRFRTSRWQGVNVKELKRTAGRLDVRSAEHPIRRGGRLAPINH